MALSTYDPKKVTVLFGGVPIGGFADGVFINISRSNDSFTKHSGADGDLTRVKQNDKSGECVITLAQSSASNDYLTGVAIADELTNDGVLPLLVKDLTGRSTFVSAFAWIKKPADSGFGKSIENREWTLDLSDLQMFVGGNTVNE